MATVVDGDQKAPFSIATTLRCRGALLLSLDCSTLPLIRTLYCWVSSKEVTSTIFKVFGMTRPRIEPRSPGPLANTLLTRTNLEFFELALRKLTIWSILIFSVKKKWMDCLNENFPKISVISSHFIYVYLLKFWQKIQNKISPFFICWTGICSTFYSVMWNAIRGVWDPNYISDVNILEILMENMKN